jgi:hypothetical protein
VSDELERRLRDSLRAYADVVDVPDDDALPTPPAAARPGVRRWRGAVLAAAAAAAVVVTGSVWVISAQRDGADSSATSAVARVDAPESTPPAAAAPSDTAADSAEALGAIPPGASVPYVLYTHCGVLGADIGGVWFAADPPLVEDDGPPPGWGNPDQPGTVTLMSATDAVFADHLGHEVRLHADESARPPLCD